MLQGKVLRPKSLKSYRTAIIAHCAHCNGTEPLYVCSVCHLLRTGVAAIFGPDSGTTARWMMTSQCYCYRQNISVLMLMSQHLSVNVIVTTSRQLSLLCSHIQSICDAMEIPHLGELLEWECWFWCCCYYLVKSQCKVLFIKNNKIRRLLNKISFSQTHLNQKADVMKYITVL